MKSQEIPFGSLVLLMLLNISAHAYLDGSDSNDAMFCDSNNIASKRDMIWQLTGDNRCVFSLIGYFLETGGGGMVYRVSGMWSRLLWGILQWSGSWRGKGHAGKGWDYCDHPDWQERQEAALVR